MGVAFCGSVWGYMDAIRSILGLEAGDADWLALLRVGELVAGCEAVAACRVRAEGELGELRAATGELLRERMVADGFGEDVVAAAVRGYVQEPVAVLQVVYGVGDIVAGANPYGCNQYGEGWAEEHDGNSTKYEVTGFSGKKSKMLINKQGGNTVEVATKEKKVGKDAYPDASERGLKKAADKAAEENAKKVEEKAGKTSGEFVYNKLGELFGEQVAAKFEQQVKDAPEWVRAFYTKYINEAVTSLEETKGISCQLAGNVKLNKNALNASKHDWTAENGVIFHEFAHALDYLISKNNLDFDSNMAYASRVLHDTIKEDYNDLIEAEKKVIQERANKIVAEHGGVFSKELFEAAHKAGDIGDFTYTWLKDKPELLHMPDAYLIALNEKNWNGKTPQIDKVYTAWHLQGKFEQDRHVLGAVCDAFNFKNGIELSVGHNKSYYKKWGSKADAMETFANLFAMYATNETKTIEQVEKYLPRTCKKFKDLVKANS